MTHAQPEQHEGHHHVNCQTDEYWIEKMYKIGFKIDRSLTIQARLIAGHGYFLINGLVFVKSYMTKFLPVSLYLSVLYPAERKFLDYYRYHGFFKTIERLFKKW